MGKKRGDDITKCPKCQHENRKGARFCIECGAKLEREKFWETQWGKTLAHWLYMRVFTFIGLAGLLVFFNDLKGKYTNLTEPTRTIITFCPIIAVLCLLAPFIFFAVPKLRKGTSDFLTKRQTLVFILEEVAILILIVTVVVSLMWKLSDIPSVR